MAGKLYGSRDDNNWNPQIGDNHTYYTLVDSQSGEITVRRKGRFGDTTVASKPAGGKWNIRKTVTTEAERTYFGSVRNQIDIVKKAEANANKSQATLGVDPDTAKKRTEDILKTGKTDIDPGTSDAAKRKAKVDQTLKSNAKTRKSFPLDLNNN